MSIIMIGGNIPGTGMVGGLIGGLIGGVGFAVNICLSRIIKNSTLKYVVMVLVALATVGVSFLVGFLILTMFA